MEKITKLEAVNRMLLGIKLAPVATIDDLSTYHEGTIAQGILEQITLETLSPGWNFNTHRITLVADTDGIIHLPAHTVDVFVPQGQTEYLVSNGRLKAILTNSTVFTPGFTVDCFVVLGFDWEDLPVVIQLLSMHKARLAFKLEMKSVAKGGQMDNQIILEDIRRAEGSAKGWDLRQKRRSALDSLGLRQHINRNASRGYF